MWGPWCNINLMHKQLACAALLNCCVFHVLVEFPSSPEQMKNLTDLPKEHLGPPSDDEDVSTYRAELYPKGGPASTVKLTKGNPLK